MSRPAIGKSNFSGGSKKKNYFNIKDGDNIYRILPAMFDLAASGTWSKFYRVEFGYKNSDNRMRPFLSPRVVNKDKMVEVESAAHLYRVQLKEEFEKLKTTIKEGLESGTISKTEAKTALDEQKALVKQFNLDSKHYMNVINENGEIGLLKIPNRAMQQLRPLLKKLEEEGVDPLSVDNGRWFNFNRQGTSLDTTYSISVVKEKVHVEGHGELEKPKVHILSDSILDRLSTEAFKLNDLFLAPSADEVARIVEEGPKAVDEILSKKSDDSAPQKSAEERVEQRTEAIAEDNKEEEAPVEIKAKKPDLQTLKKAAGITPKKEATPVAPTASSAPIDTEEDDDAWMAEFE